MNGHNLLANKLQKKDIAYHMLDNAFLEISNVETAQKLSDRINPEDLHKILDVLALRCPGKVAMLSGFTVKIAVRTISS